MTAEAWDRPGLGGFPRVCLAALVAVLGLSLAGFMTTPETLAAGRHAGQALASSTSFAYVVNGSSNTVSVVDTSTGTVVGTVAVGRSPQIVAVAPGGARVYVTNMNSNNVSVINPATSGVVATISVGTNPAGVAVSPDGTRAYVVNQGSFTVSVIATSTNAVVATIPVGTGPAGVAFSPDGTRAYVTNMFGGTVSVINTATNAVIATIIVGSNPSGVAVTPDGGRVYVADSSARGSVSVIDTTSNSMTGTIPVGAFPLGVAVTPDGGHVYVTNSGPAANSVSVIDTASNTVSDTVTIGNSPRYVAVTPDGSQVLATNFDSNSVSVIDTTSNTATGTITGFAGPQGIAIGRAIAAQPAAGVAPGAYTSGSSRFVVYTGVGRGVWEKTVGSTAPATRLGVGSLIGAPSPINAGGTRIVFGQGADHNLWQKVGNGGWAPLGGILTAQPGAAVSSADPNSYRVYVRGSDGALWGRAHTASGWGGWYSLGGQVLAGTGPSAAFNSNDGSFWVLVVGGNRELFVVRDGAPGFRGEGGLTNSSPALVFAPSAGSLVLFIQGVDGSGWFRTSTSGWVLMGGTLTSGTGGSSTATNWFAYGLGQNNQVWEHTGTVGATGSWTQVTP